MGGSRGTAIGDGEVESRAGQQVWVSINGLKQPDMDFVGKALKELCFIGCTIVLNTNYVHSLTQKYTCKHGVSKYGLTWAKTDGGVVCVINKR